MLTTKTETLGTTQGRTCVYRVKRETEVAIANLAASGVSLDGWVGHHLSSLFTRCGLSL